MVTLMLAGALLAASLQAAAGWDAERTRALQLRLDSKGAEAIAVLEAAVKRWPKQADAHYELAEALQEAAMLSPVSDPARRVALYERAATHYRQAIALNPEYRKLALAKMARLYEEDALNRPKEAEPLLREVLALDAASGLWAIKLAQNLAAQGRCREGSKVLVDARATVAPERAMLLGMSMTDFLLKCEALPLADARALLRAAERIGDEAVKRSPEDRDAVMLQGAALTALASRLPDGPEKDAVKKRGDAVFDRFMEMNPDRQRALQGEPPERVYDGFAYVNEFRDKGLTKEADRLLANMKRVHATSAEFWASAAVHHEMRNEPAEALAAARQGVAVAPRDPNAHLTLARQYQAAASREGAPAAERVAACKAGLAAVDASLALDPGNPGALMWRADLLDLQAQAEPDAARRRTLEKDAASWRAKAKAAMGSGPRE